MSQPDARNPLRHAVAVAALVASCLLSPLASAATALEPAGRARAETRANRASAASAPMRALAVALGVAAILGAAALRERTLRQRQRQRESVIDARMAEFGRANSRLQQLVAADELTGLANRRAFDRTLEVEIRRARRTQGQCAVLLVALDHFEAYNDAYGREAGEECLRRVAQALTATVFRAGDLVARLGGGEFAVLLPDTDRLGASTLAERARAAVEELGIAHSRSSCSAQVTSTVGAASLLAVDRSRPQELVRWAEAALSRAKHSGGNHTATHECEILLPRLLAVA
jgi:diguanylate cyclase (GGDEF)-like protein